MQSSIADQEGRRYEIEWDDDCCEARVRYGGRRIGRVELVWETPRLMLAEIKIAPVHQRHGLGTAVLDQIIALAKRRGIAEITGVILRKDLARNPHLPAWYARHGFRVTPAQSDNIGFEIVLNLLAES